MNVDNPFKANTEHKLRGNYDMCDSDYVLDQHYGYYTSAQQRRWCYLFDRQLELIEGMTINQFLEGLRFFDVRSSIPVLEEQSRKLRKVTGWRLVAVPGLIPNDAFFRLLADRKFPVTVWLREENELNYLVEPDIFHDFFGHVPLIYHQSYADYLELYGKKGLEAIKFGADHLLARLYWYIAEFGLYRRGGKIFAAGAGMLSSHGETNYSVSSSEPHRIAYDIRRILETDYMVDDYQKTYFVIDDFNKVFASLNQDLRPFYKEILAKPPRNPAYIYDGDEVINYGNPKPRKKIS